ncbi:hypothetical protein ABT147_01400 [Streptomyces sp. NPDC001868]|uniref:hypothetical protein n=1 Tax=Streptomyces sp. NPDC001868 TaxID=3154401 RepID=UPI003318ED48
MGARFAGYNRHRMIGEWRTVSHIVELEPEGTGTRLKQSVRLGPGRSGVDLAVQHTPEREQEIVAFRLAELRANM